MKVEFKFETIDKLDDGRVVEALNALIAQAQADIEAAPAIDKPRRITLEISLTPIQSDRGDDIDAVKTDFACKIALPKRGKSYVTVPMRKGNKSVLAFSTNDDDARQGSLADLEEQK